MPRRLRFGPLIRRIDFVFDMFSDVLLGVTLKCLEYCQVEELWKTRVWSILVFVSTTLIPSLGSMSESEKDLPIGLRSAFLPQLPNQDT